jgi:hypothetical protein
MGAKRDERNAFSPTYNHKGVSTNYAPGGAMLM